MWAISFPTRDLDFFRGIERVGVADRVLPIVGVLRGDHVVSSLARQTPKLPFVMEHKVATRECNIVNHASDDAMLGTLWMASASILL